MCKYPTCNAAREIAALRSRARLLESERDAARERIADLEARIAMAQAEVLTLRSQLRSA